jgi:hypothetical protein
LALIEQAIQLTPSYAASYSRKNKKDQGSFRYRALNFIADVKRQLRLPMLSIIGTGRYSYLVLHPHILLRNCDDTMPLFHCGIAGGTTTYS